MENSEKLLEIKENLESIAGELKQAGQEAIREQVDKVVERLLEASKQLAELIGISTTPSAPVVEPTPQRAPGTPRAPSRE